MQRGGACQSVKRAGRLGAITGAAYLTLAIDDDRGEGGCCR